MRSCSNRSDLGLLQGNYLFNASKDGLLHDERHLAEMVSLMGPPPTEFLEMSENCRKYWDYKGIASAAAD